MNNNILPFIPPDNSVGAYGYPPNAATTTPLALGPSSFLSNNSRVV